MFTENQMLDLKKTFKLVLKIALTVLAVYLVFRKIEVKEIWELIKSANIAWLLLAFLFFNLSKIISALRLNTYFSAPPLTLTLSTLHNLRLYYVGMFYNLFLPGGIGGDGYKVYVLNRDFNKPVKQLLAVSLLDRINGLVSLLFYSFLIIFALESSFPMAYIAPVSLLLALICYPAFYVFCKLAFPSYNSRVVFTKTNAYSLAVQFLQLVSAYFILLAIGGSTTVLPYLLLFLLSSIVAVLPLTIGGIGARELVFLYGHEYFGIPADAAVTLSVLFFLITAISSFGGTFLSDKISKQ